MNKKPSESEFDAFLSENCAKPEYVRVHQDLIQIFDVICAAYGMPPELLEDGTKTYPSKVVGQVYELMLKGFDEHK